jgi:hypothetical protein
VRGLADGTHPTGARSECFRNRLCLGTAVTTVDSELGRVMIAWGYTRFPERFHHASRRFPITRRSRYVLPLVALFVLVICGGASAFVVSHARSGVVQPQPPPGTCHVRGSYPFTMPDPRCTPGALNPAVTQATIAKTICRRGYSSGIRPSTSVTGPEKRASIRAYGFHQGTSSYEYDHLISLELGGAANDSRNLWPENGPSPNLKDNVENYLHVRVCDGRVSLGRAQRIIALDWVSFYKQNVKPKPKPPPPPPPPPPLGPPDEGIVHPGAFCSPEGATGDTTAGTPMVCGPASDGRDRWHSG